MLYNNVGTVVVMLVVSLHVVACNNLGFVREFAAGRLPAER